MEIEQLKNIIKEETQKQIMNNLDSSLIFTYINNLEEENKKLKNIIKDITSIPEGDK